MKSKYSEAFIEQALVKLLSRGERTVRSVAQELNVNYHKAKNWIKKGTVDKVGVSPTKEKRPRIGMPRSNWWRCMKPMACLAMPCMRGVAPAVYLPII